MTKNDIKAIITATAARRGFTAEENTFMRWPNITEPGSHYLNYPEKLVIPRNPKETNAIGCINQENSE